MLLQELLVDIPGVVKTIGNMETQIGDLITDSREKTSNGLFFCIPGIRFDAHAYAPQAVENGCTALVVERVLDIPVPQVLVKNVRSAVAYMAGAFFGGCPNTTYGESVGCVAISGNASIVTILTTAIMAIVISFFAPFAAPARYSPKAAALASLSR